MKRLSIAVLALFCACATQINAGAPLIIGAAAPPAIQPVNLDGRWILSDILGVQSCLTIQEWRVSIIDLTCSSDGLGAVARIIEKPRITLAGDFLTLSATFNPRNFDESRQRLLFTGVRQPDGSFVGTRFDTFLAENPDDILESFVPATLTRKP